MPSRSLSARCAAASAAALVVLSALACSGRVGPLPQQQNPTRPQFGTPDRPLSHAAELFDLGAEGEARFKGKVVAVYGKVNVGALQPAPAGGTVTAVVEGDDGEPPYAIAVIGPESNELLFGRANQWRPITSVGFHGVYRERDGRGTIILDPAQAMSVSKWSPDFRVPRKTPADRQPVVKKPDDVRPADKKMPVVKNPIDKKPTDKTPKAPVVVSPEKLGQELTDDIVKNYPRYYGSVLQIKGVVHKRAESDGSIVRIDFQVPVKLKDGKKDDFVVFCGLKTPVPLTQPVAADLAVGKTVTIRGKLSAGGNGQATLHDCEVVRE